MAPVPKNTETAQAEAKQNITETVGEFDGAPVEVESPEPAASAPEPHDFEVRRAALELAISARSPEPVQSARDFYRFLAGDVQDEATV